MNHLLGLMPVPTSQEQRSEEARRLSGIWLVLARVGWLVIALLTLSILIIGLPAYFTHLQTACGSVAACTIHGALAPEGMRTLQAFGISAGTYAAFLVVLTGATSLVWTAVGWLIFWRKSEEVMALFVALLLVTYADVNTSATLAFTSPAWLVPAKLVRVIAGLSISLSFYLFPNGRFVPRWTRWFALLAVVYELLIELSPAGSPIYSSWLSVFIAAILVGSMLFAQLYRYRKVSTPIERQQTKWAVFGMLVAMVGVLVLVVLYLSVPAFQSPGSVYEVSTSVFLVVMLSIPVSIGIAILRSRLWDIDLIINRTLVYGVLTVSVVALYVLIVVGLGTLVRERNDFVLSLLATGFIAVLFQPLRERVQQASNRLMFGERDDPYRALARLGRRLEAISDPVTLLPLTVETVAHALKLPYVALQLASREGPAHVVTYGAPQPKTEAFPLVYAGERLGSLLVAPRTPGEPFSRADQRLLADLVRPIGIAVHALQLATDLEDSKLRIVTEREQARRRLGNDLHDGLAQKLMGMARLIEAATNLVQDKPAQARTMLSEVQEQCSATLQEVRSLAHTLHPPELEILGLEEAIRERCAALQIALAGSLHIIDLPASLPPLPIAVEVAAYYIVQEALTNVQRHAHAKTCTIHLRMTQSTEEEVSASRLSLWQQPVLAISIVDDGCGWLMEQQERTAATGLGLLSIRERAHELGGSCTIVSEPTRGTHVQVYLPCPEERTN